MCYLDVIISKMNKRFNSVNLSIFKSIDALNSKSNKHLDHNSLMFICTSDTLYYVLKVDMLKNITMIFFHRILQEVM